MNIEVGIAIPFRQEPYYRFFYRMPFMKQVEFRVWGCFGLSQDFFVGTIISILGFVVRTYEEAGYSSLVNARLG